MSIADNLVNLGITYSDVKDDFCKYLSKKLFDSQVEVEERDIVIPDNSTHLFASYTLPENEEIESLSNGLLAKIDTPSIKELVEVTAGTIRNVEDIPFAFHGQQLLFNTESEEQEVTLKILKTDKDSDNLHNSIHLDLQSIYYYLYIGDSMSAYQSIQSISNAIGNLGREALRTKSKRKVTHGTIKPVRL